MTAKARVAVIGTGWWSTYTHIPALLAHPQAELVALCDTDPAKLQAAAAAYAVDRVYASAGDMLDSEALDGVVIAAHHAAHAELARLCLARGLHVMLEKPMTLYAADARELVELARAQGRELIIGYPWHYTPQALRARDLVRSGALGAVQYVSCTVSSSILQLLRGEGPTTGGGSKFPVHGPGAVYSDPERSGGGQGHLQITHSAGLLFFVTGLQVQHVLALMRNHGLPLDLVDVMAVAFEGGALGMVGGTGNSHNHRLDLQVRCERGGLDLDIVSQILSVQTPDGRIETYPPAPGGEHYPRSATANNLVDVILGVAANGSPAEDGWRTVELLDAAYRSAAAHGQPVWVKDLYGSPETL
jgi:predicted dehydrogenase